VSFAGNRGARISELGFVNLVKRAEDDGVLAEKIGLRPGIPAPMFGELLVKATAVVRDRMLATAPPDIKNEINRILAKVAKEAGARVGPRTWLALCAVPAYIAWKVWIQLRAVGRVLRARTYFPPTPRD